MINIDNYQREGSTGSVEDVLRPGCEMVVAGYCMYGSSANMVISLGSGVNGYTLDNVRPIYYSYVGNICFIL